MIKFRCRLISVVFLSLFLIPQNSYSQKKVRNIVVFFSFGVNIPAYQNILEGFKSTLLVNKAEPANLMIEYLDVGRSDNNEYARFIIDLYSKKYTNKDIDLLITIGPWINGIIEKYVSEIIKTTPVISIELDIPGIKLSDHIDKGNIVEIIPKIDAVKTLKAAFKLFPDYKNVYVVSGSSKTDQYFTSFVKNGKREFEPEHNFIFISEIDIDSTIKVVKLIPPKSIVIVPSYLSDVKKSPFSTPEALNVISGNTKAPVFPITDSYIKKEGGIGGNIFSYTYMGKEMGIIASEILRGRKPNEIIVNTSGFYKYIFDWKQLKKWRLLGSKAIPGDSIFYNEEIPFFDRYKWYAVGLVIFIISQTILILYLVRLNRRQKEISRKSLETEMLYRELVREDRLAKMTELTASLSHELNQPLTAILYSAQAGKRFLQSGKLEASQADEIFNNIIEDDKRAGGIISSVRSLMKLENREMEIVDLMAVICETVDIYHSDAIRQGIKIILTIDKGQVLVSGDKIQLQQVLMNFMRNATNAMENIDPEKKIMEISLIMNKNMATVSVRDSGPGIDESIRENMFRPFITSSKKGFGIGLALSRSIIERHKGEIWAENMPGSGARFSFKLRTYDS